MLLPLLPLPLLLLKPSKTLALLALPLLLLLLLALRPKLLPWPMLLPLPLQSKLIYLMRKKPPTGGFFYVCDLLRYSGDRQRFSI